MTAALVLRYLAFQVPGWVLVGLGAWIAHGEFGVDGRVAAGVAAAWLAKDAVMFPFVRVAYAPHDDRGPGGLRGAGARVVDPLVPDGRVRVGPELWRARLHDARRAPLEAGARVRVREVEGLTLVVEPEDDARR